MKPINYYTTVSEQTETYLENLDYYSKLCLIRALVENLIDCTPETFTKSNPEIVQEISRLNFNKRLGLIKALADHCQETLISK